MPQERAPGEEPHEDPQEEPRKERAGGSTLELLLALLRGTLDDLRAMREAALDLARVRADRARLRVIQVAFLALMLLCLGVAVLGALGAAGVLLVLGVAGGLGRAFELPGWLASLLGGLAVLLATVLLLLLVRRTVLRRFGRSLAARYSAREERAR